MARDSTAGTPDIRIFSVDTGATVTFTGLTIAGGLSDADGGGILNSGTATSSIVPSPTTRAPYQASLILKSTAAAVYTIPAR